MWFVKVLLLLVCCNSLLLNAAERQDPTKPSLAIAHKSSTTEQVLVSEQLNLNAIKLDGKHKIAIINQMSYREGQMIAQDRIKKIMSDKVVLSSGITLYLFGRSVVRISK
ncbi:MAG: hypothetical protein HRU24_03830 [Gammaproteobacteria bacterium]|nr:hypothetical protein [Gammaproteobacteria bacterium]